MKQVGASPIISGSGNWTFMYLPDRMILPPGACTSDACNCHGLEVDAQGNIILTYEPDHNSSDKHCMVRFEPDGTRGVPFGPTDSLCAGTPHGLRIAEEGGKQFLYHANNAQSLHKTTLNGTLVWSSAGPPGQNTSFLPYRPTWFAAPPGSKFIYLADGYGSNLIHVFTVDGEYTGNSFGGAGSTPGKFNTCHGINFDPRVGHLVVSDRGNHRHQYFRFDPTSPKTLEFASEFSVPELALPCHVRFAADGVHAVVPSLAGPVGVLNRENKMVSVIEVSRLLGAKGHLHPHDAALLPSGDLVVATWNPGRVSYWKRVPPGTKTSAEAATEQHFVA